MKTKVSASCYRRWAISGLLHRGGGLLLAAFLIAISATTAAQEPAEDQTAQPQVLNRDGQREKASAPQSCVTKPESVAKIPSANSSVRDAEGRQEQTSEDSLGKVSDEALVSEAPSKENRLRDLTQSNEKTKLKQELRSEESGGEDGGRTPQCTQHDRSLKTEAVTPD